MCVRLGSLFCAIGVWAAATAASAQDPLWAQKMFDRQSVDFGVVARGAVCSTRIVIKNIYQETIQITNVSTSCGCSAAKPSANQVLSGQEAYIEISMDTQRFMRKKDSAALVTLVEPTKGLRQEIRIPLSVYIRTDVVFTPGMVNFGAVEQGQESQRKITLAYAGRPDWEVKQIRSPKPYYKAEAVETSRGNGLANYDVIVTLLPDAPAGALREQLTLITNDLNNPEVPLPVEARVESEFTVQPPLWALGTVAAGTTKTTNVVIKGRKPFKIDKIECSNPDERFKVKLPEEEKIVHVLPLTFTAPTAAGEVDELFTVTIPGRLEPLTFRAKGRVVAAGG
ncbi:MAG TPA: DUF1573 domain-containing protein [Planctomycetaceae bacterium]|nr:DUF1573 domain-containing protein [Planctomycetaceae bacterium]